MWKKIVSRCTKYKCITKCPEWYWPPKFFMLNVLPYFYWLLSIRVIQKLCLHDEVYMLGIFHFSQLTPRMKGNVCIMLEILMVIITLSTLWHPYWFETDAERLYYRFTYQIVVSFDQNTIKPQDINIYNSWEELNQFYGVVNINKGKTFCRTCENYITHMLNPIPDIMSPPA